MGVRGAEPDFTEARLHAELRFKLGRPSDNAANWDALVDCARSPSGKGDTRWQPAWGAETLRLFHLTCVVVAVTGVLLVVLAHSRERMAIGATIGRAS